MELEGGDTVFDRTSREGLLESGDAYHLAPEGGARRRNRHRGTFEECRTAEESKEWQEDRCEEAAALGLGALLALTHIV